MGNSHSSVGNLQGTTVAMMSPQYPTHAAEALVRAARAQNAVPILFPEWARLGVDEAMLVYDLQAWPPRAYCPLDPV